MNNDAASGNVFGPITDDINAFRRLWERERLGCFVHGVSTWEEHSRYTLCDFDQVEYFRRVFVHRPLTEDDWQTISSHFRTDNRSFLIDCPGNADVAWIPEAARAVTSPHGRSTFVATDFKRWRNHFATASPPLPNGATLEPVDERSIDTFSRIYLDIFEADSTPRNIAIDNLNAIHGLAGWFGFLVRCGPEPIGCTSVFLRDNIAFLSVGGLTTNARGLRLHRPLIDHRIRFAIDAGAELIFTYAATGSVSLRNALACGFVQTHELTTLRVD